MNARQRYNERSVRNVPFDELLNKLERALAAEQYEDAALLRDEHARRQAFRNAVVQRRESGPFYVWTGWNRPISEYELRRSSTKLHPPYVTFSTWIEAAEWLDPGPVASESRSIAGTAKA